MSTGAGAGAGAGTGTGTGAGAGARQQAQHIQADVVVIGAGIAGLVAAEAIVNAAATGTASSPTPPTAVRQRKAKHAAAATPAANSSTSTQSLRVVVLEATNRVGGRMQTQREKDGFVIDLGATWVGPTQHHMLALIQRFGLEQDETYVKGTKVMNLNGRVTRYSGLIPNMSVLGLLEAQFKLSNAINAMAKTVPLERPWQCPHAEAWDACSVRSWAEQTVASRDAVDVIELVLATVLGCRACDMSLLHFLYYVHAAGGIEALVETRGGAQHAHVVGGMAQIVERLAAAVTASGRGQILTACPVERIDGWNGGTTTATTTTTANGSGDQTQSQVEVYAQHTPSSGTLPPRQVRVSCSRVVVAIPASLCERIRFTPALPPVRRQLHTRVMMPCMSKFVVRYKQPWWREAGLSGEGIQFTQTEENPVCSVFDYCQAKDDGSGTLHAALVAFASNTVSLALTRMTAEARKAAVVGSLVRLFGPQANECTHFFEKQWEVEEWTGGCPVNVFPAGQFARFARVLRAPVGALHWAGTETATVWTGYMDGAAQSGQRAAAEILQHLAAAKLVVASTPPPAPSDGFESTRHTFARRSWLSTAHRLWQRAHISLLLLVAMALFTYLMWRR